MSPSDEIEHTKRLRLINNILEDLEKDERSWLTTKHICTSTNYYEPLYSKNGAKIYYRVSEAYTTSLLRRYTLVIPGIIFSEEEANHFDRTMLDFTKRSSDARKNSAAREAYKTWGVK